jgi:hypothetical protein
MHGNVVQNGTNRRGERLFGRRASSSGGYSMVVEIGIPVTTGLPQMKAAEALAKSSANCNHVLAYVVRALTAAVVGNCRRRCSPPRHPKRLCMFSQRSGLHPTRVFCGVFAAGSGRARAPIVTTYFAIEAST